MVTSPLVVLFDVDGTLITTEGRSRHSRAFRAAFEGVYGAECQFTSDMHGMTDMQIFRHLARSMDLENGRGRELAEEACRLMVDLYRLPDPEDGLYIILPGVLETVERLADVGALLGLVTGNAPEVAADKLSSVGLDGFFTFGGYGTESDNRGDLPPLAISRAEEMTGRKIVRERVFVIGDTPRDVACARESGCRSVAVGTGIFGTAELESSGADLVLPYLWDQSRLFVLLGIV